MYETFEDLMKYLQGISKSSGDVILWNENDRRYMYFIFKSHESGKIVSMAIERNLYVPYIEYFETFDEAYDHAVSHRGEYY